ncbi:MAG: long-chain-fatty-acid--CoA ligase [Desulfomonile tiedjei]|uniref:Long-chain-fatty-acid--CoA ligase n=1 Tax=Desulfomonile tiedjei TaxID=2358 RepID=A0A9D6V1F3_9BACT|nr:long-chain-fatty-acid--CoA ligase [Desulfomonile tiedjei]
MGNPGLILKELSKYEIGTYAEILYRNALFYPDREAFSCDGKSLTFRSFNSRVNRIIRALQDLGLRKGDVIGVLSWNSMEYAEIFGAAMKGGFVISPFNARLQLEELRSLVQYSEAKAIFVGPEFTRMAKIMLEAIPGDRYWISFTEAEDRLLSYSRLLENAPDEEPSVRVERNDPLFIFFTSGTTGTPKGAVYTHARAIEDTKTYVMMNCIQPSSRFLMIMPFFHIGGAKVFWSYFYVGASHVIMKSFDAAATLKAIDEEVITDIHIVPTHLTAFFSVSDFEKYNVQSLKRVFYAASPMPVELLKKGLQVLGPVFAQGYGSTETGPNVCCLRLDEHQAIDGTSAKYNVLFSCGRPNLGVQVRVVDQADEDLGPGRIGEIVVRGNTMIEYWHEPEETEDTVKADWTHTGDMGYYDELGFIYIADRKKDMIISGGENVYPREVEEVLYQHPGIKEAAVIGLSDPYWVERVHAVVVPKNSGSLSEQEVIAFCKSKIAGYKIPKTVEFVSELPKTPAGKVLKRKLREERSDRAS